MSLPWDELVQLIINNDRFVLTSHIRPDCDALGSELGLAGILDTLGKEVTIVNGHETPPNLAFIDPKSRIKTLHIDMKLDEIPAHDVLAILDTSAWAQLGPMGDVVRATAAKKIIIDHHVGEDDLGATPYKNVEAEATGRLITELADRLGVALTREIATPLFAALVTDTGVTADPAGMIETRLGPRAAQAATRGNESARGRTGSDDGAHRGSLFQAKREIFRLGRILIPEIEGDGRAVRLYEGEVLPLARQLEVRVEPTARIALVLFRRVDDEIPSGPQRYRREPPHGQIGLAVGQVPIVEVHICCAGVEELDPIRIVAVFVGVGVDIEGHEFRDDDTVRPHLAYREQAERERGKSGAKCFFHGREHHPPQVSSQPSTRMHSVPRAAGSPAPDRSTNI